MQQNNTSESPVQLGASCEPVVVRDSLPTMRVLRLSVTDRCNFRCRYCMPKGLHKTSNGGPLPLHELAESVRWLVQHTDIQRVKVTGGEPLIRPGIEELVAMLASIDGLHEISMTTNGSLLPKHADRLKAAGLARVNISLDSMDPARFSELSRGAQLENTLAGIDAALQAKLLPIKLNAVLQRSNWQKDVPLLLDMAARNNLELRFIELMRTGSEREWCAAELVPVEEVMEWLAARAELEMLPDQSASPARESLLQWNGVALKVGWIAPRSRPFCSSCERLRMDSRGRLRRCMMDPITLNVAELRKISDDGAARQEFERYMAGKHPPVEMDCDTTMNQIGG